MGIILEKSKLVFDELIGLNSFDEIFKNSIRDYYAYGFKSYDQFLKGSQIVKDRWKVFSKVLGEKWHFEKGKKGRNQIVLKTNPSGVDNPVDDLYFLHNLSKIGDYLNYLIDLDERSRIRGGIEQLPVDWEDLETVEGKDGIQSLLDADSIEYAIISNWQRFLESDYLRKENPFRIRINRQLNIWSCNTRYMPSSFRDKYANLSNRTVYLYQLGILGDLRDDTEKRNQWLKSQWEEYDPNFKKYFSNSTSGNHYWFRSPLTMKKLCEIVATGEEARLSDTGFDKQLRSLCNFFSQYYPLGELGTILAERLGSKVESCDVDGIRFKHNYLQKTLYDYNLIDILIAIENRYLCLVEYTHGINLRSHVEVVVPLEIRISVTNGREYVMYYDITQKRIKALRLEFIDKISVYSHIDSIETVQYTVSKQGKKIHREEKKRYPIQIDSNIAENVTIAHKMLPFIWGTEVSECYVTGDWQERLIDIILPITYESKKESYIANRVNKERRNSNADKSITVFPTKEIRSWVRSFYKRVDISAGENVGSFDVYSDVNALWNVYFGKETLQGGGVPEYKKSDETEYIEYSCIVNGVIVSELEGHGALFNELFSRYAVVLADSVLTCSSDECKQFDGILSDNIKDAFDYYSKEEAEKVRDELKRIAYSAELIDESNKSRFIVKEASYLFDVLPLTKMEARWLKTVLEDPLAKVFLNEEQITMMLETLKVAPYEVTSFMMESINYFDRYNLENRFITGKKMISQEGRHTEKEISFLKTINHAITNEQILKIVFRNWKGEKIYITCAPIWVEYSRRDDVFRLWYIHKGKNEIRIINISRMQQVLVQKERKFDKNEQRIKMQELYAKTMISIKVEFYQGEKNLPDRILTEFSLWKKKCTYNIGTQKYTMTLYYSSLDEKEILVRLLSYGPYIKVIADEDNYILAELKERIVTQRDRIQEREFGMERLTIKSQV